jgi:sugar phosphate isomerase/epimerase
LFESYAENRDVYLMKIGWCADLREAALLHRLGFDFIELPLTAFGLEDRARIDTVKAAVATAPLPTTAFNQFFPRNLRLVGKEIDADRVRNYLAGAAEVLHHAHAKVVVLGSASSRDVPDGFDQAQAEDQFLRALSWCADAMKGAGTLVAIEPLNRRESNFINSVAEGVHFAKRINRPEIRVLADFYHMDEEHEPLDTLRDCAPWLAHIHLADTGRRNPGSGSYDYDRFMGLLKEIGYRGAISSECKLENPEPEMRSSFEFLSRYWPEAR